MPGPGAVANSTLHGSTANADSHHHNTVVRDVTSVKIKNLNFFGSAKIANPVGKPVKEPEVNEEPRIRGADYHDTNPSRSTFSHANQPNYLDDLNPAYYKENSNAIRPRREQHSQFFRGIKEKVAKFMGTFRSERSDYAVDASTSGSGSQPTQKESDNPNTQSSVELGHGLPTEVHTVLRRDRRSSAPLEGSFSHGVSSNQPPNKNGHSAVRTTHQTFVATPGFSEHSGYEIYYEYLFPKRRGIPLWEPGPHRRLPTEYRKNGISIGDVGILNLYKGTFIFLFNIFLRATDDINRGRVPDGFVHLDKSKAEESLKEIYLLDRCHTSSSINSGSFDFEFETTGRHGAVLVMPNGGLSQDLENEKLISNHISRYAESWWEYVQSEKCGVQTDNGTLEVIIGTDKVSSWAMATFENVEEPRKFKYNTGRIISQTRASNWENIFGREGPTEEEMSGLSTGPTMSLLRNQCIFVRTLDVFVPDKVRDKLAVEVCSNCSMDYKTDSDWHERRPRQRPGSVGTSQARLSVAHPLKLLNKRLLEKHPTAKVIITSYSDWSSVITENDTTMPSGEDICERVLSSHIICENDGVITLEKRQNGVTRTADDPSMTELYGTLRNDGPEIDKCAVGACSDNLDRSDAGNREADEDPIAGGLGAQMLPPSSTIAVARQGFSPFEALFYDSSAPGRPSPDSHDITASYQPSPELQGTPITHMSACSEPTAEGPETFQVPPRSERYRTYLDGLLQYSKAIGRRNMPSSLFR